MSTSKVVYQEVPRDFRTEIPNIVFVLLENGQISYPEFVLYSIYRKIAGQNGACWVGTRGLAEKTGLSRPTITKAKKNLSSPFSLLKGKSLIDITPCDNKSQIADTVTIIDIWPENYKHFKEITTCAKREHRGVQNNDTGVCKITTQKNEPKKKEPYKKRTISNKKAETVHKPQNESDHTNSVDSSFSTPLENSFDPLDSKELEELLNLEDQYSYYFRPKIVAGWIKKYGPKLVLTSIKFFYSVKDKQKKPILKPEAWMEISLKKDFASQEDCCAKNKAFAEKLKKDYDLAQLKIAARYCLDIATGKDYYYHLPEHTFTEQLKKLIK